MNQRRILTYIMTFPFILGFVLVLCAVHPILMVCYALGDPRPAMALLNRLLVINLKAIAGARLNIERNVEIPEGRPVIFVSNHQSMFDIPLCYSTFEEKDLKFIAKLELGKWIPSISFVLRNLGSALIRRDDPRQSILAIKDFGKRMEAEHLSVLFFPEGTRARDGHMKKFLAPGLITLLKAVPSAVIVPVVIDGSWEIVRWKLLPVPFGVTITLRTLAPIERSSHNAKELTETIEKQIRKALNQIRQKQEIMDEETAPMETYPVENESDS